MSPIRRILALAAAALGLVLVALGISRLAQTPLPPVTQVQAVRPNQVRAPLSTLVVREEAPVVPRVHTPVPPDESRPLVEHIIIMDKENRTFDSMFGTFPGADGATTYVDGKGKIRPLNHQPDRLRGDIDHSAEGARRAFNGGKMNLFSTLGGAMQHGVDMADSQFYRSDIPNYWAYASTYTLADSFFSSIAGGSFPNHLFSIAG